MPDGTNALGEQTRVALERVEAALRQPQPQVAVDHRHVQALVDALRSHGPVAASVDEVAGVREMLETILQNPDEPNLPIDILDEQTVTLAQGDLGMILGLLMFGPRSNEQAIVQSDRERACEILEKWGGLHNAQVVFDTARGARDDEDGYAGDLVRAFRNHRVSAPADKA